MTILSRENSDIKMSPFEIKKIEPSMLGSVSALEAECFSCPWSESSLSLLCGDGAVGFVALEGERVLAYGGMITVLDEGQITNIATSIAARRRGCASAVLDALLEYGAEHGICSYSLEVRQSNLAAIGLYEKHGFCRVGLRKNFYSQPVENAIVMIKNVK